MTDRTVSGDEFRAALAPGAVALQELAREGRQFRQGRTLPDADSIAMRELAQEAQFAGDWNDEPVTHAY